ncbi:MAG: Vms1/Ankzf1 family peptidyl-tRNA hydrolase [Nitrospirae bacterium]|nr:Vms1/Ankzf1 family peptidyl-tRNA hydrolase [Nitrospirota bacterium]
MLNQEELKEIATLQADGSYFVSLYLNVSPSTKGDYVIHLKNMLKNISEETDKKILKKIKGDIEKLEAFVTSNKREFKKGLAIITSYEKSFWKEYHLAVPVKNAIIADKTPYIQPLLDIIDNYKQYAVLLVDKESARLFLVHLGEIEEYGEVHTQDVPGKHKRGGWFSLSGHRFERHIDYHVSLHIKDVVKKLESFLAAERIERIITGGSDDAIAKVREMLPKAVSEKIVGAFHAEMFANVNDIFEKVRTVISESERIEEKAIVSKLLTSAGKGQNAVIGIEDVLNALQEGRVIKLIFIKDFEDSGYACRNCRHLSKQKVSVCPYCKGGMEEVNYLIDLAAQRAVEQGSLTEVIADNKELLDAGGIGAFLRF